MPQTIFKEAKAAVELPGQLLWFDRSGKQLQASSEPGDFVSHQLSPDGKKVAVQALDIFDVTRDGQRFLISTSNYSSIPVPLTLVTNWESELKKK